MTISINFHSASVSERQEGTVAGAVAAFQPPLKGALLPPVKYGHGRQLAQHGQVWQSAIATWQTTPRLSDLNNKYLLFTYNLWIR